MEVGSVVKEDSLMDCDMDCNMKDTTAAVTRQSSSILEKPKAVKRKKIRRLIRSEDGEKVKGNSTNKCKRIVIMTALVTFTIALLMGHYLTQNNSNTKQILKDFLKNYRSHYWDIVHGKNNYCDQNLDIPSLFSRIHQQNILHQDQAIRQIEVALRNESNLNAIAIVGPVGVGKSLFIRALQQNFPWQENVHTYAWNTYVSDEAEKFHLIRILAENLSDCGQNLLIIENLHACDNSAVTLINQLLSDIIKKQHKRVVLFYVFNLNTMLPAVAYAKQQELLQTLPDCSVVNFKSFTQYEIRDCIKREVELENVSLTEEDYDEIVNTIDPMKSGCKNVNAKVLMYGTIKSKDMN